MSNFLIVNNIIASQTPGVIDIFIKLLNNFDTIIEIGFHRGGFSKWIFDHKAQDSKLICYDISFDNKEVHELIDFRLGNCFDITIIHEIKNIIESSGRTLILCDGGNKEKEFAIYSQYLKPQDVIMLHDYCDSDEEFLKITKNIIWDAPTESRYSNIEYDIIKNNLKPYYYNELKQVLWGAFEKI